MFLKKCIVVQKVGKKQSFCTTIQKLAKKYILLYNEYNYWEGVIYMIARPEYLKELKKFKDKDLIKKVFLGVIKYHCWNQWKNNLFGCKII